VFARRYAALTEQRLARLDRIDLQRARDGGIEAVIAAFLDPILELKTSRNVHFRDPDRARGNRPRGRRPRHHRAVPRPDRANVPCGAAARTARREQAGRRVRLTSS
jgi:hypothetical protein